MKLIETKVIAAMGGSGLAAALSAFLMWALGVVAFGAPASADQVGRAVAAVPEPVGALLAIIVAIGGAFVGGYSAPHTSRPDLTTALTPLLGTLTAGGVFLEPGQTASSAGQELSGTVIDTHQPAPIEPVATVPTETPQPPVGPPAA